MTALALSAPFAGSPVVPDDLVDRLAARRREVAALEAECTAMVAELIRRDAHDDLGYRSMVSLLVDRLGIAPGVARGMMRLAPPLLDMPHTRTPPAGAGNGACGFRRSTPWSTSTVGSTTSPAKSSSPRSTVSPTRRTAAATTGEPLPSGAPTFSSASATTGSA